MYINQHVNNKKIIIIIVIIIVNIITFSVADKNFPSVTFEIYANFIFNYTDIFSIVQFTETHFTPSASLVCCGFNYSVNL